MNWIHLTDNKSFFATILGNLQDFLRGKNWERAVILPVRLKLCLSQSQMAPWVKGLWKKRFEHHLTFQNCKIGVACWMRERDAGDDIASLTHCALCWGTLTALVVLYLTHWNPSTLRRPQQILLGSASTLLCWRVMAAVARRGKAWRCWVLRSRDLLHLHAGPWTQLHTARGAVYNLNTHSLTLLVLMSILSLLPLSGHVQSVEPPLVSPRVLWAVPG